VSPNCVKCGDEYNPRRAALGYPTCLDCGSPKINFPVLPMTKSNYVVCSLEELRTCSYAAKGVK